MHLTLPPAPPLRNRSCAYPSLRNGRYEVRSTADGWGRSSFAQIAVLSAARCLPTVHCSNASPRSNERSAALIAGVALPSGTAPSGSASSSGFTVNVPSLVRTTAALAGGRSKIRDGATSEIAKPFLAFAEAAPSHDGSGF